MSFFLLYDMNLTKTPIWSDEEHNILVQKTNKQIELEEEDRSKTISGADHVLCQEAVDKGPVCHYIRAIDLISILIEIKYVRLLHRLHQSDLQTDRRSLHWRRKGWVLVYVATYPPILPWLAKEHKRCIKWQ